MKLTKERQKATGAFYTPKWVAEKAVEYIQKVVPCFDSFTFWDCAAGEGALLDALPENCKKYATTLEDEDVDILRNKGHCANQFDFLAGDASKLWEISEARENGSLIVFTNPPYVMLPKGQYQDVRKKYKTRDATALFYQKILNDIEPTLLCSFSKCDLWLSSNHEHFRKTFHPYHRTLTCFITKSKDWGLKGSFPIYFNVFLTAFNPYSLLLTEIKTPASKPLVPDLFTHND